MYLIAWMDTSLSECNDINDLTSGHTWLLILLEYGHWTIPYIFSSTESNLNVKFSFKQPYKLFTDLLWDAWVSTVLKGLLGDLQKKYSWVVIYPKKALMHSSNIFMTFIYSVTFARLHTHFCESIWFYVDNLVENKYFHIKLCNLQGDGNFLNVVILVFFFEYSCSYNSNKLT